jgi:hydroxymethylpyrimidine/phosphomethylpyrimidine kinase
MSSASPSAGPPVVLAFAATDPTGGAGLQADLLTAASLGCHPLSVVTAVTVQDTAGVEHVEAIAAALVERQARRVLADTRIGAFKLGVLGSVENVRAIARLVAEHPKVPLVLDPVLASGRGDPLASEAMIAALLELIVPRTTIATPNSIEDRRLGGQNALRERGCRYVLVTGTHDPGAQVVNTLYGPGGLARAERWQRLPGEYHGSGCTLASAIAAALAHGRDVPSAAHEAQEYTWHALAAAFRSGKGQLTPDRLFRLRETESK